MTDDEELIARLRDADLYNAQHYERDPLHKQSADRIESLLNLNEAWVELLDARAAKLARAEWLLTDAAVQLEDGKIKTRRNRAGLIWQFLEEIKAT